MNSSATWKVTFDVAASGRESIEDALIDLGAAVVSKQVHDNIWTLEAIFTTEQSLDDLKRQLAAIEKDIAWDTASSSPVEARNWIVESQHFRQPVRAGIYYVHESHSRPAGAPGGKVIEVAASLAFGTGQHASTEGCLLALSLLQKKFGYRNILDLGSGSGILAIAAAKTWNARVLATDIDPIALPVAQELAKTNQVASQTTFHVADGFRHAETQLRAPFDLIIANILAGPLMELAGDLRKHIAAGGTVVLSGLLNTQSQGLTAAYRTHGMVLKQQLVVGNWSTLILGPRALRGL